MKLLLLLWTALLPFGAFAQSWTYNTTTDPMTSRTTKTAVLESPKSLSLRSPYEGRNIPRLYVRQHPQWGTNVYVTIDQGQILCRSYEPCRIMVRFDSGEPSVFNGIGAEDGSSEIFFFQNHNRAITNLKKAKRILIQVPVYQDGVQLLEFSASKPLEW